MVVAEKPKVAPDDAKRQLVESIKKGIDVTRPRLRGVDLSGADFMEMVQWSINFSGADLRKANFVGADVRYSDFTNAKMEGADVTGAQLDHTTWTGVNMKELQNLDSASLYDVVVTNEQDEYLRNELKKKAYRRRK